MKYIIPDYNSWLQLKQTATRSLDDLDGQIIKLCTLTYIYNFCIDKHFSKAFKQAMVMPLYKSGDNTDPSYRRISILSVLSTLLEKRILRAFLRW